MVIFSLQPSLTLISLQSLNERIGQQHALQFIACLQLVKVIARVHQPGTNPLATRSSPTSHSIKIPRGNLVLAAIVEDGLPDDLDIRIGDITGLHDSSSILSIVT